MKLASRHGTNGGLDWAALEHMRALFLSDQARAVPYWTKPSDLESYDATFGARIGWKWQAVLHELAARGYEFQVSAMLDWGCGSGIASRALLTSKLLKSRVRVDLWDHSNLARDFANARITRDFSEHETKIVSETPREAELLLISHVLNELSNDTEKQLKALLKKSELCLWVENGTQITSRRLSAIRDELLATGDFDVLAPCTHAGACGVLAPQNAHHWCHSFCYPPDEVHHDPQWDLFSKKMGIDLRRQPYSFLVLVKKSARSKVLVVRPDADRQHDYRLLGLAREYKGFSKLLCCQAELGVADLLLQKRDAPGLLKIITKAKYEVPLLHLAVSESKATKNNVVKISDGDFLE